MTKLDAFLQFNEYDVLKNAGKVSHEVAVRLAEEQYRSFSAQQDMGLDSDFEKASRKMLSGDRKA